MVSKDGLSRSRSKIVVVVPEISCRNGEVVVDPTSRELVLAVEEPDLRFSESGQNSVGDGSSGGTHSDFRSSSK
jgi:hypothetical protein